METKIPKSKLSGSSWSACRHYLLLPMLLLLMLPQLTAQTRSITGTVRGTGDDAPLIGASIVLKGTTTGTVTDIDGTYAIDAATGDVLVFSYIGYEATEVLLGDQTQIDVTLAEGAQALDELVVLGYGTAERKEVTNSVASVGEESFNKGNVNDPAQLLQGKVAGLSIAKPGGDPNAGFNIRLRGLSTFGANSQPLIVIDGVLGGSLQTVDPNDIESIEVLKDGAAAAIYGTRGASGVIIVTTRRANIADGARIDFNAYTAVEQVARFVPNSTPAQYREAGGVDNGAETNWLDLLTRDATARSITCRPITVPGVVAIAYPSITVISRG